MTTVVMLAAITCAGCSSSTNPSAAAGRPSYAVGELTKTFVDTHRTTPAHGNQPALPKRTLPTTILYPAVGNPSAGAPSPGASPEQRAKPYPLIIFSHGLGADAQMYRRLLSHLAAAGFVVAAPDFPLTSSHTPGGPDAADVVNQPGDDSFVLTSVLQLSASGSGPLAGLIDPAKVGAAGHSLGAITTLGLVANTCCRDKRVKAAAALAAAPAPFPHGHFDLAAAPPLLLVHGTNDEVIPYSVGVGLFNEAQAPKYLLTVQGGGHGSAAAMGSASDRSSVSVLQTITDFFKAYLNGDQAALARLPHDDQSGVTTMHADPQPGKKVTIPTPEAPKAHLRASVKPNTHLRDGQVVTVRWSGYTKGKVVSVLQCAAADAQLNDQTACDFADAKLLHPDPAGEGSLQLKIKVGKVGNSACDATHQGCFIIVNNASGTAPADSVKVPITVAQ